QRIAGRGICISFENELCIVLSSILYVGIRTRCLIGYNTGCINVIYDGIGTGTDGQLTALEYSTIVFEVAFGCSPILCVGCYVASLKVKTCCVPIFIGDCNSYWSGAGRAGAAVNS